MDIASGDKAPMTREQGTSQDGFTLAEMLVAMAVLAILSGLLIQSLQLSKSIKDLSARIDNGVYQQSIVGHLREELKKTIGLLQAQDDTGNLQVVFSGDSDRLEFLVPSRLNVERGGLSKVLIYAQVDVSGASELFTSRAPYMPQQNLDEERPVRLMSTQGSLKFRYFGAKTIETQKQTDWWESWTSMTYLPRAIEVRFQPASQRNEPTQTMIVDVPVAR